jgi:hypothetical protein
MGKLRANGRRYIIGQLERSSERRYYNGDELMLAASGVKDHIRCFEITHHLL